MLSGDFKELTVIPRKISSKLKVYPGISNKF